MRNHHLDIAKGLLLCMVVAYHVMGKADPTVLAGGNAAFNLIASFFMQGFFLISGYLFAPKAQDVNSVARKCLTWWAICLGTMPLYWAWGTYLGNLMSIFQMPLWQFSGWTIEHGFLGLVTWYLWTLALCVLLVYGCEGMTRRWPRLPLWAVLLAFVVAVNALPFGLFGVTQLGWYGLFFVVGYLWRRYSVRCPGWASYAALGIFPLLAGLFGGMADFQSVDYGQFGFVNLRASVLAGQWPLIGASLLMALTGSAAVYGTSRLVGADSAGAVVFGWLGRHSLPLYLGHILFVGVTPWPLVSGMIALAVPALLVVVASGVRRKQWASSV